MGPATENEKNKSKAENHYKTNGIWRIQEAGIKDFDCQNWFKIDVKMGSETGTPKKQEFTWFVFENDAIWGSQFQQKTT